MNMNLGDTRLLIEAGREHGLFGCCLLRYVNQRQSAMKSVPHASLIPVSGAFSIMAVFAASQYR